MRVIEIDGQEFELASRFARWFAQILDFSVLVLPWALVAGVLGGEFDIPIFHPASKFMLAVMVIWIILYYLFQDGLNTGRSLGKRIMSMRVVDAQTGIPCRYWQSVIRNLFPFFILFSGFLIAVVFESLLGEAAGIFAIVGVLLFHGDAIVIFGEKRQRLGEKVAKTFVVKGNPPKNGVPAGPPKPVKTFFIGIGILVGLGAATFALFPSMPYKYESTDALFPGMPYKYESTDGLVQITAPILWDDMTRDKKSLQMEDSTLVICDEPGDVWIMIITETKEELRMIRLSQFAELVTNRIISNLSEVVSVSDPIQTTLSGHAAIQYEIQGAIDGDGVVYLHTSVEGKRHYHQVIGFTLREQKLSDKVQLQQIVKSFKELR